MLEKYLQEIGLSEKESQIYLALLQVDSESIQDIAKKTGINRTTVYPVLESLNQKGLVSEVQDGKKTMYQAAPPERLETFVERQKVLLTEKAKRLKDIIPEIKGIQRQSGERPIIKFFEGRDGVVSAYEEFYSLVKPSDLDGFLVYDMDLLNNTYTKEEQEQFYQIRAKKKIKLTAIYGNKSGDYNFITPGCRTRLDSDKYPISTDITVIGDSVILSSLGDHVSSFIIKSKDIASTLRSLITYVTDQNKKG